MNKIVALWRCRDLHDGLSDDVTARRLGLSTRAFGEAWYQGLFLWPRFSEGEKTTPGLTDSVWEDIQSRATGPVFLKDFPHYIVTWAPEFLVNSHMLLIRDPAKTLTSLYHQWNDFDELEGIGAAELSIYSLRSMAHHRLLSIAMTY